MTAAFALLLVQITFSFLTLGFLTLRLRDWASRLEGHLLLELLLWVHLPRAVPLGLLAPGQVVGIAPEVLRTIAFGDFLSAVLALASVIALRAHGRRGMPMIVLFSVVSCVDILLGLTLGLRARVFEKPLGFSWYVLTCYVPAVCISQVALIRVVHGSRVLPNKPR